MAKKKTAKQERQEKLIMTQTFIEAVQAEMAKTGPPDAETTRPVRLDLTPDIHRRLRIAAAFLDTNMSALARTVVEAWLIEYEASASYSPGAKVPPPDAPAPKKETPRK